MDKSVSVFESLLLSKSMYLARFRVTIPIIRPTLTVRVDLCGSELEQLSLEELGESSLRAADHSYASLQPDTPGDF